jgi:predicted nucleic acid-binding protein
MENLVCLDTSVLIDFFRKQKSEKTLFIKLIQSDFSGFYIPVTVEFEIYYGANQQQLNFWNNLFTDFIVLPLTQTVNAFAIDIAKNLRRRNKSIEYKDLVIAATALSINCPLATINKKHFENIEGIELITPADL